jgi:hypothetical protein
VIKRIISKEKKEWVVISSDREVMTYAWSQGGVPVASDIFQSIIENTEKTLSGKYDLLYEEEVHMPRKGSSRTPSRKEKALLRTLRRL